MNECESCVFSNYWNGKDNVPLCNLGHHRLDCTDGMTGWQYSNSRVSNVSTADLVNELASREGVDTHTVGVGEFVNYYKKVFGPAKIMVVVD
jgi:hypothetical protein